MLLMLFYEVTGSVENKRVEKLHKLSALMSILHLLCVFF